MRKLSIIEPEAIGQRLFNTLQADDDPLKILLEGMIYTDTPLWIWSLQDEKLKLEYDTGQVDVFETSEDAGDRFFELMTTSYPQVNIQKMLIQLLSRKKYVISRTDQ